MKTRPLTPTFKLGSLDALSIQELSAVYDACQAAGNGVLGVVNSPRCQDSAEAILSDLLEQISRAAEMIAARLKSLQPDDDDDRNIRAMVVIAHEMECGATPLAIAALAARLAQSSARHGL